MLVNQDDYDRVGEKIIIRRGCDNLLCACLGKCRDIVGYILRADLDDYISRRATLKDPQDFLSEKGIFDDIDYNNNVPIGQKFSGSAIVLK